MKYFLILVAALATSSLYAQSNNNGPVTKLTFRDAVKRGLERNVELQIQRNELDYTQLDKTSAMLGMGPSIDAEGAAYRNDGNSFNQNQGRVVNGVIDFVNASVSASMPIFNGFRQMNNFRAADKTNDAQMHRVAFTQQEVIRNIASQYLTCLLDYELVKIDEKNVEAQRIQYEQIKSEVEVGSKAEADLYNQDYQVKNAELLLVRSRNTLKNDMAILAATIQLDPSIQFELEDVNWDMNSLMADSVTLNEMYAIGLERRSDLKEAEFREKAAQFSYSAMKGNYFPRVNAGITWGSRYNYIYDLPPDAPRNRSFDEQFREDNRQVSYGLSVYIPIYSGLQARTNTGLRKVAYKNATVRKNAAEVVVKSTVLLSYQNYVDAKTNYQATAAQLKAAELSYKTEKERYDLGISNIVQLTTANQAYIKAQGDYQSALFTLMFQKLLTAYAMGTLQFEDIPE